MVENRFLGPLTFTAFDYFFIGVDFKFTYFYGLKLSLLAPLLRSGLVLIQSRLNSLLFIFLSLLHDFSLN